MTTTRTQEIWFTTAKSGRRMAWTLGHRSQGGRSFRVGLAEAELLIATGQAVKVDDNPWGDLRGVRF